MTNPEVLPRFPLPANPHALFGGLAKVAAEIAEANSNIDNVTVDSEQGDQYATMQLTLQVSNRLHLAQIIRALRRIPEVIRIARVKS